MSDKELLTKLIEDRIFWVLIAGSFLSAIIDNIALNIIWFLAFIYFYLVFIERVRKIYAPPPYLSKKKFALAFTWYSIKILLVVSAVVIPTVYYAFHTGLLPNPLSLLHPGTNVRASLATFNLKAFLRPFIPPVFLGMTVFYFFSFSTMAVFLWEGKSEFMFQHSLRILIRDLLLVAFWTFIMLLPMILHNPLKDVPNIHELMAGKIPQEHFSLWPVFNAVVTAFVTLLAPIHLSLRYGRRLGAQSSAKLL